MIPSAVIPTRVIVGKAVVVSERVVVREAVVGAVGMSVTRGAVRMARVMGGRVRMSAVPRMPAMATVPAAMSTALGEGRRRPHERDCDDRHGCQQVCACHDKSPISGFVVNGMIQEAPF
jgi:hypothetical protein